MPPFGISTAGNGSYNIKLSQSYKTYDPETGPEKVFFENFTNAISGLSVDNQEILVTYRLIKDTIGLNALLAVQMSQAEMSADDLNGDIIVDPKAKEYVSVLKNIFLKQDQKVNLKEKVEKEVVEKGIENIKKWEKLVAEDKEKRKMVSRQVAYFKAYLCSFDGANEFHKVHGDMTKVEKERYKNIFSTAFKQWLLKNYIKAETAGQISGEFEKNYSVELGVNGRIICSLTEETANRCATFFIGFKKYSFTNFFTHPINNLQLACQKLKEKIDEFRRWFPDLFNMHNKRQSLIVSEAVGYHGKTSGGENGKDIYKPSIVVHGQNSGKNSDSKIKGTPGNGQNIANNINPKNVSKKIIAEKDNIRYELKKFIELPNDYIIAIHQSSYLLVKLYTNTNEFGMDGEVLSIGNNITKQVSDKSESQDEIISISLAQAYIELEFTAGKDTALQPVVKEITYDGVKSADVIVIQNMPGYAIIKSQNNYLVVNFVNDVSTGIASGKIIHGLKVAENETDNSFLSCIEYLKQNKKKLADAIIPSTQLKLENQQRGSSITENGEMISLAVVKAIPDIVDQNSTNNINPKHVIKEIVVEKDNIQYNLKGNFIELPNNYIIAIHQSSYFLVKLYPNTHESGVAGKVLNITDPVSDKLESQNKIIPISLAQAYIELEFETDSRDVEQPVVSKIVFGNVESTNVIVIPNIPNHAIVELQNNYLVVKILRFAHDGSGAALGKNIYDICYPSKVAKNEMGESFLTCIKYLKLEQKKLAKEIKQTTYAKDKKVQLKEVKEQFGAGNRVSLAKKQSILSQTSGSILKSSINFDADSCQKQLISRLTPESKDKSSNVEHMLKSNKTVMIYELAKILYSVNTLDTIIFRGFIQSIDNDSIDDIIEKFREKSDDIAQMKEEDQQRVSFYGMIYQVFKEAVGKSRSETFDWSYYIYVELEFGAKNNSEILNPYCIDKLTTQYGKINSCIQENNFVMIPDMPRYAIIKLLTSYAVIDFKSFNLGNEFGKIIHEVRTDSYIKANSEGYFLSCITYLLLKKTGLSSRIDQLKSKILEKIENDSIINSAQKTQAKFLIGQYVPGRWIKKEGMKYINYLLYICELGERLNNPTDKATINEMVKGFILQVYNHAFDIGLITRRDTTLWNGGDTSITIFDDAPSLEHKYQSKDENTNISVDQNLSSEGGSGTLPINERKNGRIKELFLDEPNNLYCQLINAHLTGYKNMNPGFDIDILKLPLADIKKSLSNETNPNHKDDIYQAIFFLIRYMQNESTEPERIKNLLEMFSIDVNNQE